MAANSIRELGRRVGVSHVALRKAVIEGRLTEGVCVKRGKVQVVDVEAAAEQWQATPRGNPVPEASELDVQAAYWVAKARREAALADMAEIEVAEKRSELVPVAQARADVINAFTTVKTKILGVPSRVAQRFPQLALEIQPVIDALLREVLEELADDESDGDGEAVEA